ncbi:Protein of unknown function [Lactobacillus helveticus CIRM-BIA 953]|nr:Protein of unknown function [Lactobacillus helveticus CIRM-BIA 953]
MRDKSRA